MELTDENQIKKVRRVIVIASIAIPVVVALLFKVKIDGFDLSFLPGIYATINGITAVVLLTAYIAIKRDKVKNRAIHRSLIRFALLLSLLFLLLYVLYHMTSDSTVYGDTNHNNQLDILERSKIGMSLYPYYVLLISHIILSVAVIPLVLFTYLWAWQGDIPRHKKWNRIAFPIWLYVAISGVLVYLMISPYY